MINRNNKSSVLFTCTFIAALISGCGIGNNKTLFFTKTNVGLDFDSQPPTAEVTIARREGVIAPTFEGGQTPPILASFHLESEGFAALFAGISSTFVGGDSAVAFAELYDDDYNSTLQTENYDSTLELSKLPFDLPPKERSDPYKDKRLYQPGDVEPFLFGTDTSFGLKVGWSGMTAQVPDTVRLGFNRKEFALAPVTVTSEEAEAKPYKVKIPSFLATIENSTRIGAVNDSGISHLQYFATGKAADKLSLRYSVRKAMATRLDPEAAREFGASLQGESRAVGIALLGLIEHGLMQLRDNENSSLSPQTMTQAGNHLERLSLLVKYLPNNYTFTCYRNAGPEKGYFSNDGQREGDTIPRDNGFADVKGYLSSIDAAIADYNDILTGEEVTVDEKPAADLRPELLKHMDAAKKAREEMRVIGRDPALIDAAEFYFDVVFGR